MPYDSQAQAAYFNEHKDELEKQGVDVGEWNRASKGLSLPEHSHKAVRDKFKEMTDHRRSKSSSR